MNGNAAKHSNVIKEEVCSTPGCEDPVGHKGRHLCNACNSWIRYWTGGKKTPDEVERRVYQIHRLESRVAHELPRFAPQPRRRARGR